MRCDVCLSAPASSAEGRRYLALPGTHERPEDREARTVHGGFNVPSPHLADLVSVPLVMGSKIASELGPWMRLNARLIALSKPLLTSGDALSQRASRAQSQYEDPWARPLAQTALRRCARRVGELVGTLEMQ